MTNKICLICQGWENRLNGRWCRILGQWVEYAATPPCDDETKDNTKPDTPKTDKR